MHAEFFGLRAVEKRMKQDFRQPLLREAQSQPQIPILSFLNFYHKQKAGPFYCQTKSKMIPDCGGFCMDLGNLYLGRVQNHFRLRQNSRIRCNPSSHNILRESAG
jgi:hypothetical protein